MKKIIACILLAIMILNVTACEIKTVPAETTTGEATLAETTAAEEKTDPAVVAEIEVSLTEEHWKTYDRNAPEAIAELSFSNGHTCEIDKKTYTWTSPVKDSTGIYCFDIIQDDTRIYFVKMKKGSAGTWEIDQLCSSSNPELVICHYIHLSDFNTLINEPRYQQAQKDLNDYLQHFHVWRPGLSDHDIKKDQKTLESLYHLFQELGDYKDSEAILNRFAFLPEMQLTVTEKTKDSLGNYGEHKFMPFSFNRNGKLKFVYIGDNLENFYRFFSPYDPILFIPDMFTENLYIDYLENGQIEKIWTGYKGADRNSVKTILTPIYDEDNKIVKLHIKTAKEEHTDILTYDKSGKLSEITGVVRNFDYYEKNSTVTYSYDKSTKSTVKKVEVSNSFTNFIYTYFYDSDNILTRIEKKYIHPKFSPITTEITTVKDDKGRPVSATVISSVDKANGIISRTYEFTYEDCYVYDGKE